MDLRIKKIRQYSVSVMLLCLAFLGVYFIQEKTSLSKPRAELEENRPGDETQNNMLVQSGETELPWGGHAGAQVEGSAWSQIFGTELPEIVDRQEKYCVVIRKKGSILETVSEEQIYRRVTVTLQGSGLSLQDVYRVCGTTLYNGAPDVTAEVIPEEKKNVPLVREPKREEEDTLLSLAVEETDGKTKILLEFNSVYEITVEEDAEFLYLSLLRPYEVYDKIIVIDPGHGGIDSGTSGGGTTEATINLAVVRYVKKLLEEREDWKVYYTRLDNTLPDLSTRVEFANALHADLLISVHCNYNPVSAMNGVEVLYSSVQGTEDTFNSRYLATLCSKFVAEETGLQERKLVERSTNLHIIKYCEMPMALIEFGFMSNAGDLSIILTEEGQKGCARAIYRAIEAAYEVLEKAN